MSREREKEGLFMMIMLLLLPTAVLGNLISSLICYSMQKGIGPLFSFLSLFSIGFQGIWYTYGQSSSKAYKRTLCPSAFCGTTPSLSVLISNSIVLFSSISLLPLLIQTLYVIFLFLVVDLLYYNAKKICKAY